MYLKTVFIDFRSNHTIYTSNWCKGDIIYELETSGMFVESIIPSR